VPDGRGTGTTLDLILHSVRRFGRTLDGAAMDRAAVLPPAVLAQAADLGLFGLSIPEVHGGLGLSLAEVCEVVAELAAFDRSVATTVGLHCGLGTRGLVELGSPGLKDRWLPALAAGEVVASFCATEPGAGSDLTGVRTTARQEGEHLVVDGEKAYVTNGGFAGLFTVLARTPGMGGVRAWSLVCVPRGAPGLEVGPEECKLGIRASSTTSLRLDGVRVDRDGLLGTPGEGMAHAHRLLEWGRTLMSAGCVGTARAALGATLTHVTSRRQFGRTLMELEPVRMHVAAMGSQLWAMEALLQHVGRLEARGEGIALASAAAKVFCSEAVFDICDRAVQLHGAMGFVEDTGVARLLRDCRVTRIFEGANDVLLGHVATGLAASAAGTGRRLHPLGGAAAWDEVDACLAAAVDAARRRRGLALVREQCLLRAFGQAHVWLLAASAALARAEGAGPDAEVRARHACHLLVSQARRALENAELAASEVERDAAVARLLVAEAHGSPADPSPLHVTGASSKTQGSPA
jgi:alkylation response protein AidB-like acyl-CoA dehydrogenase